MLIDRVKLAPERDVEDRGGWLFATGNEPWLSLGVPIAAFAARFVEITYSLSFWDEPVRPIFRFWHRTGFVDRIGGGPIGGRAAWVGRVPPGTERISVSPTNRPGAFGFAVDKIRTRQWTTLLVDGFRRNPRSARSAALTRLIGWGPESDVNLAWAIGSLPFSGYAQWRQSHERPPDLTGFERPRFDWITAPPIHLVISAGGDDGALQRTIASLQAQIFPHWRARILAARLSSQDARLTFLTLDQAKEALATDPDGTLSGVLAPGETLFPTALAVLAEQAHRTPEPLLFYGDEQHRLGDGARLILKPGWSPRLQAARGYLGGPVFVRRLNTWDRDDQSRFLASGDVSPAFLATLDPEQVVPLRRILAETRQRSAATPKTLRVTAKPNVEASIIIPTRDHPALLQRVVTSIRERSRPGSFRIVIVDNASVEASTKALFTELRRMGDTQVIHHPGPFNFSLICNEAAAAAQTGVLVFLNDDMEVVSEGWLDRLVAHAMEPDIGAVGARLTFPDGRLQHVGVLVGMGESAGHFGALAAGDDPGWAGRNEALHEVSAVTGACLAVARDKFEAVGGFDATHLPIELSDIDLCLKLNARGWQTIVDPEVHLMHEESTSRGGATLRRLIVHDRERATFVERWRYVLRDDPFFHPGLSLYRWQAALG